MESANERDELTESSARLSKAVGSTPPGTVFLVGAGPGDVGLLTCRGAALLALADAVVYDALANPELLDLAPPAARRVYVGKRAAAHTLTQDQIHQCMLDLAREGLTVVRLKGGDPYLFGRGAEEVGFLAAHGVRCEVVPGITSGIAAPAFAGIPVTHRRHASSVTFMTGHEEPGKAESALNYRALADMIAAGGTVCIYMGVGRLDAITSVLTGHGLAGETPAAVVQWGGTPRQRSVRATVATVAQAVRDAGLAAPAIVVLGAVAGINEPGLDFYTDRPLFGRRILVTRTRKQASDLKRRLADAGADVLEAPTIELVPPTSWHAVDAALRDVRQFDWLILTSANGVTALAERLDAMALDARHLAGVRIAAVGTATVDALRSALGIRADLVPTRFVAESLAAELIASQDIRGRRLLLLRADIARPDLPRRLTEAGGLVTELVAYETRLVSTLPDPVLQALRNRELDWVTFTSASTANNLVQLLGEERDLLQHVRIASIGPITSAAVRAHGLTVHLESASSDVPSLVTALADAAKQV